MTPDEFQFTIEQCVRVTGKLGDVRYFEMVARRLTMARILAILDYIQRMEAQGKVRTTKAKLFWFCAESEMAALEPRETGEEKAARLKAEYDARAKAHEAWLQEQFARDKREAIARMKGTAS